MMNAIIRARKLNEIQIGLRNGHPYIYEACKTMKALAGAESGLSEAG